MVFPTFFHLSLNLAIRSSWSEPQSTPGLIFADSIELLHLWLQRIQSIWFWYWPSGYIHLQSHRLCFWKRVFAMTSAFSWQTLLYFALPHFVLQGQTNLLLQVSLDFLLLHSSRLWWKERLFLVLTIEGLVGLHRTVQLQPLQRYWLGHRLWLPWYWMVCLGNELKSLCHFWGCMQVLHFRFIYWLLGLFHFFYGILAPRRKYSTIWIKFTHSHTF